MTIFLGFISGFVIFFLIDQICLHVGFLKKRLWDNPITFFGLHVHHSFFGLVITLLGLVRLPFLIGFGLGMIIEHTITDKKLVFIEKVK